VLEAGGPPRYPGIFRNQPPKDLLRWEEVRRSPVQKEYQGPDPFSSPSFKALQGFVADRVLGAVPDSEELEDFEKFESDLHEQVAAFEASLVAARLSCFDEKAPEVEVHGTIYRRKDEFPKEYCGLAGKFEIPRALYVPRDGGKAICPLELRVGMVEGVWTPLAARVMARAVSASTPREAAALFEDLGGMKPSESSLDRLPKQLSDHWEENRVLFEDTLRSQEVIPGRAVAVGVSLDGVLVPMKEDQPADDGSEDGEKAASSPPPAEPAQPLAEADKKACGPKGYREVGCGTITLYDAEGNRMQTTRYARAPEYKKGTLKSQLVAELQSIFESRPDLVLIGLSDGAEDHWEFINSLAPLLGLSDEEFKRALDIFHGLERVKKALDAYHGEGTSDSKIAFEECRIWLREEADGVERVLRALRHRRNNSRGAKRKAINTEINYLAKRKSLMRYKELLDAKLPIGSGIMEAACKTLASERLKRSGMRWGEEGCQAILTLRSLIQSDRWESGWELMASQYKARVDARLAA
jgi:hypothetical protein